MPNYKQKNCKLCEKLFIPTSGSQVVCPVCIPIRKKLYSVDYEKKKHIKKQLIKSFEKHRICPICKKGFFTLDSKKIYCGSLECEKERCKIKNRRSQIRRTKKLKKQKIDKLKKFLFKTYDVEDFKGEIKAKRPSGQFAYTQEYVKYYFSKYGYTTLDEYKDTMTPIRTRCPNNHDFIVTFSNFLRRNQRCKKCALEAKICGTKSEGDIFKFLVENGVDFDYRTRTELKDKELDFYIKDSRVAIEVCGLYWHSEVGCKKEKRYHRDKYLDCLKNGIKLITIFEDEYVEFPDVVQSKILAAIKKEKKVIKNVVVEIISNKVAHNFLRIAHLKRSTTCKFSIGAFKEKELVGVMTWGAMSRAHTKVDGLPTLELKRLAFKPYVNVVGGTKKLFNFSIEYINKYLKNIKFLKVTHNLRYVDDTWEDLGFSLFNEISQVSCYIDKSYEFRAPNRSLKKTNVRLTEWELRKSQGYDRIWDCGHRSYIFYVKGDR